MSLPEIIPSNLPVFVQLKNRSAFANSVVPPGSVLFFAESDGNGGANMLQKKPDGTFSEVCESSINFYKCASVDAVNHTWTGYLASIDSTTGVWSFAETATSGLTFDRLTPVVGSVYDEGCSFMVINYKAGLPEDGLVFYLPLTTVTATAPTGQTLSIQGTTPIANTIDGISCLGFSNNGYIYTTNSEGIPTGTDPWTMSVWLYNTAKRQDTSSCSVFSFGSRDYDAMLDVYANGNQLRVGNFSVLPIVENLSDSDLMNQWIHMLAVNNGISTTLYLNGEQKSSANSWYISAEYINIGGILYQGTIFGHIGYLAAARIYNRALSASEISALASEFTPTA